MRQRWAVQLDCTEVGSLGRLRLATGAEVCQQGQDVWVRGEQLDDELARVLRRHPHARRHWVLPDNQLVSPGRLVPSGHLPPGPWHPLTEWLTVRLPAACAAPVGLCSVTMRLVRSSDCRPANVLLTDLDNWVRYGSTAHEVRLSHCFFAVDADQRVVVRGTPLPPLLGELYAEQDGIAVAVGWTWRPAVDTTVVKRVFRLQLRDLALWHANQTWELVPEEHFVRATRAAIRATARECGHA